MNKKSIFVLIVLILIFVLIVLYLLQQNTGEKSKTSEKTSISDIATKDSDNDGIPDWKEDLLGDQVEKKYFESRTRPRRISVNTRTQEIIANVFERGKQLERSGALNEDTAELLAADLLSQLSNTDDLTRNIKIPSVTDEATEEVKEQFEISFLRALLPITTLEQNELQILQSILNKEPGSAQKLQALVIAYESVYDSLADITVPQIILDDYLELYTIFSIQFRAFELFLNVRDSQSYILLLTVVQQALETDENGNTRIAALSQNIYDTLHK